MHPLQARYQLSFRGLWRATSTFKLRDKLYYSTNRSEGTTLGDRQRRTGIHGHYIITYMKTPTILYILSVKGT